MYQWEEQTKSSTNSNTREYKYRAVWDDGRIDSESFKKKYFQDHLQESNSHHNPEMPFQSKSFMTDDVTVGEYSLTNDLLRQLPTQDSLSVEQSTLKTFPESIQKQAKIIPDRDNHVCIPYKGHDGQCGDKIGDIRVTWKIAPEGIVSLYGALNGSTLVPFSNKKLNNDLYRIEYGKKTAKEILTSAQNENVLILWILRLFGWAGMAAGFMALFSPLNYLANYIPFLNYFLNAGMAIISFLLSTISTLVVIGLGWLNARPVYAYLFFWRGCDICHRFFLHTR